MQEKEPFCGGKIYNTDLIGSFKYREAGKKERRSKQSERETERIDFYSNIFLSSSYPFFPF